MQIPQIPDRVKEAPAQALRAVFAGVGQLLLIADRIKNSEPGHERTEPAAAGRAGDAREHRAAAGDAREHRAAAPAAREHRAAAGDAREHRAAAGGAREHRAAAPAAREHGATAAAALPVPNYDDLSLASLRGRLRNLDQAQLRVLADYERAHAGREAVAAMFERRIVKLEITRTDQEDQEDQEDRRPG